MSALGEAPAWIAAIGTLLAGVGAITAKVKWPGRRVWIWVAVLAVVVTIIVIVIVVVLVRRDHDEPKKLYGSLNYTAAIDWPATDHLPATFALTGQMTPIDTAGKTPKFILQYGGSVHEPIVCTLRGSSITCPTYQVPSDVRTPVTAYLVLTKAVSTPELLSSPSTVVLDRQDYPEKGTAG